MADKTSQNLIDSLDALLDRERQALLVGDLEKIGRLLALKESLMDQLSKIQMVETDHLQTVKGKVNRNQALLNSAMEGIQAVASRMAELRKARHSLETYDHTGRKTQLGTRDDRKLEKRA